MDIEVWMEDEKVGTYDVNFRTNQDIPGEIAIRSVSAKEVYFDTAEIVDETMWISTKIRSSTVSERDLSRVSAIVGRDIVPASGASIFGVPDYADASRYKNAEKLETQTVYSWYVLAPRPEQFEAIFLSDRFKPL